MENVLTAVRVYQEFTQPPPVPETFLDKHFIKIAFAVATLALIALAPLDLFVGTIVGFAIHHYSKQPVDPSESIITLPHAVLTIVGAVAALIRFTPGGALGGFIFLAVPAIGSLAVGATADRAFQMAGR